MSVNLNFLNDNLSNSLNVALANTLHSFNISLTSHYKWKFKISDDLSFISSDLNKLANKFNLDYNIFAEAFIKNIKLCEDYFTNYKVSKKNISFTINNNIIENMLFSLYKYLSNQEQITNNKVILNIHIGNKMNNFTRYKINLFSKAKQSLYRLQNYIVEENYFNSNSQSYISIEFSNYKKIYNFPVPVCDYISKYDLPYNNHLANYSILNSSISSCSYKNYSICNSVNNDIYLLSYMSNINKKKINLFTKKEYNNIKLSKKFLMFPLYVENCNTKGNFKSLFYYLNELLRLTFYYDLWQNCTEKISLESISQQILHFCYNDVLQVGRCL